MHFSSFVSKKSIMKVNVHLITVIIMQNFFITAHAFMGINNVLQKVSFWANPKIDD